MTAKDVYEHALIAKRLNDMAHELREISDKFVSFEIPFSYRLTEPCSSIARAEQAIRHAIFEAAHRFAELSPDLTWLYHRPDLYDFESFPKGVENDGT